MSINYYYSLLIFHFPDKNSSDIVVIWVTYKSDLHDNFDN